VCRLSGDRTQGHWPWPLIDTVKVNQRTARGASVPRPALAGIQARWTSKKRYHGKQLSPDASWRGCASLRSHELQYAPIQTQPPEELHQSLVDRTFQCAYACQWTLFHASRSFTLPGVSAGGGSLPSLYNRAALPAQHLARASGARCSEVLGDETESPCQMQALCG